jgi:VWFA-related protein
MITSRVTRWVTLAALVAGVFASSPAAQDPQPRPEQPRFRGGANLVRVDAYVAKDGAAITDLSASDFELLEDGVPQRIENFEIIRPRGPAAQSAREEPSTVAESRAMATAPDARLFVLFLDIWHVHLEGSYRAKNPMINLLDRVIGQDDMIGLMTPEMSARNLTLARRTTSIETLLRDNWYWGQRQRLNTIDPREREIQMCYPDTRGSETEGIAPEMIDRRRERKTLDAVEDLIIHLEGLRDERKFVVLLSEGWRLPRRDDRLARTIDGHVPKVDPIGIGPDGRLGTATRLGGPQNYETCERERQRLAADDLEDDFRRLLQRANRANISFYTVDPRGLTVFDEDLSSPRALDIGTDRAMLGARHNSLRELAENTDGVAVLNTSNIDGALNRMLADIGTYYLLGYYSTNTRLDGKFRKLTVRVKRPDVQVRARPGYLAPTEAEAATARVDRLMNGAAPGHSDTPPEFRRALESLTPVRGGVALRVNATAGAGQIWITTELDAAALKTPEWQHGGTARVSIEHETGAAAPIVKEVTLAAGERSFDLHETGDGTLPPGRYVIRLSMTPTGSSLPLQTTVDVTVPEETALIGKSGMAYRRGPSTGLQYLATADARFQRTERVRFEVPRVAEDATVTARLLSRNGQPLPLTVTMSERTDEKLKLRVVVADLTLAPLAQGEYVLEVTAEADGKKETAAFGFRIVP